MGKIYWLTGQPGAGKTTLAQKLSRLGLVDFIVDGDDLRQLLPLGYDEEGRRRNIDRAQAIAAYLAAKDRNVAVAVIAPYRDQRETFKDKFHVAEIYVHTTQKRGRESFFAADYQPPETQFLDLDTGDLSIAQAAQLIRRAFPASA